MAPPHPIVPGNKLHVATTFVRFALVGGVMQEILQRLKDQRRHEAIRAALSIGNHLGFYRAHTILFTRLVGKSLNATWMFALQPQ